LTELIHNVGFLLCAIQKTVQGELLKRACPESGEILHTILVRIIGRRKGHGGDMTSIAFEEFIKNGVDYFGSIFLFACCDYERRVICGRKNLPLTTIEFSLTYFTILLTIFKKIPLLPLFSEREVYPTMRRTLRSTFFPIWKLTFYTFKF
jgi:hypothetical protein